MKFVLFHGSYGSSEGNWFPYLKNQLELINQDVLVPQFPIEDHKEILHLGEKKAKAIKRCFPAGCSEYLTKVYIKNPISFFDD